MQTHYRPQAEDTTIETDRLVFSLLRSRSIQQRLNMGASLTRSARQLSLSALRYQYPNLSPTCFARKIAEAWLQEFCPLQYLPSGNAMTWIQDSIGLAQILHPILQAMGLRYYITGGVAAIAYGEPRTTQDLDLVMDLDPASISHLVEQLEMAGFYVPGVEDITSGRISILQITHMESISRADLVIANAGAWTELKYERRQRIPIEGLGDLYFASPEDLILSKLSWGKQSRSDKQWRDVLGILKVQSDRLDRDYLNTWAETLSLTPELTQAFAEAGL
ncbi:MAG: hypothetical protein HC860_00635 [Alkalinema sp. RU_4_3]|nr:hypothetical protein [Alkalinema sp. RU_4_3]